MIVRDEERFLPGCLASLEGIVDEVVVVDTGSVDGSVEIARGYGARVLHRPWAHDFAAARNVSLEAVRGRWVLYIDADEQLAPVSRAEVEALLEGAEEVAFRILLQPLAGTTPYREYRLWRNDPRIRFEGVIHEKVVPAIHQVAAAERRAVGMADLLLVHRGYEGDQTAKHRRNLPLLRRELEREPAHLFAWHHLARVLAGLGDDEGAEAALVQAVEIARSLPRTDPVASLSYVDLIRRRQSRGEDVSALLAEARAAFPDNCVVSWIEARHHIGAGRYEEALESLGQILGADRQAQRDWGPAYDTALLDELPWDAAGLCHFRLGAYREAAAAYRSAANSAPDNPTYRAKSALALARARAADRVPKGGRPVHSASTSRTAGLSSLRWSA